MRSWMTILLVLFGAAFAQAGVEKGSDNLVHAVRAELSQGNEMDSPFADTPLLATTLSSVSSRLSGAETMPARVRYPIPAVLPGVRGGHDVCDCPCDVQSDSDSHYIVYSRAADKYVYALRKILI